MNPLMQGGGADAVRRRQPDPPDIRSACRERDAVGIVEGSPIYRFLCVGSQVAYTGPGTKVHGRSKRQMAAVHHTCFRCWPTEPMLALCETQTAGAGRLQRRHACGYPGSEALETRG